jgi:hypothetical protein
MKRTIQAAKLLIALSLPVTVSSTLSAAVVGTFDIGGNTATVNNSSQTTFNCDPGFTIAPCPAGSGNALIDNATGGLTPFLGEGVFVGNITQAFNRPILTPNWLTITPSSFNSTPSTVALNLTFLPLGVGGQADCSLPAAPGQTCTPTGAAVTPFNPLGLWDITFANTNTGFTATFDVKGTTKDLVDGSTGTFIGTFTATVNGSTFQQALAEIAGGTAPPVTYTASFTLSAVPEPSYLFGFGALTLIVASIVFYRKRRLQRQ